MGKQVKIMKKLHLICNAHLDTIWQWTWDEGLSSVFSTFKSAADLAEEFDYIFCHGEALLYETIETHAPELFERIKKLVKAGKWVITGGWYLQPDCLMPSGESFVRQIKIGEKYFMEKFGVKPEVATNFDSFGHSLGLVQIMQKCGYKGYMICRPKAQLQFDYPSRFFNWVAPNGSSIVVTNCASYNSALGKAEEKIRRVLNGDECGMLGAEADGVARKKGIEDVDYVLWGVGNHGGGPSRKDLRDIAALKVDDVEIFHSTPEQLFSDNIGVEGEVKHSLITCMPGCYSSMSRIKQAHRETENLFYATEKMLCIAKFSGYDREFSEMDLAEKKLLLAQFHDILPGTVIADGEKEGLEILSTARNIIKDYRTGAFLYLVMGQEKAKEGEYPVFVFNYMPYEVTVPVEVEFMLADQNWSEEYFYLPEVYQDCEKIPSQQIKEDSTLTLDWRKRMVFEGKLKPMGITRFDIKPVPVKWSEKKKIQEANLSNLIKNSVLPATATLEMYDDTADPWGMSDEELISIGRNAVPFRPMTSAETASFCGFSGGISPIHTIEDGAVVTSVECAYTAERTNALIEYRFYKNQPFVDLKVTVEYGDKNKLVKLKIPAPQGVVVGDGPYIIEEKPTVGEVSFQKWLGVKEENGKIFSVINDCLYAGSAKDGYLYFTLLRGSGYCFHPIYGRELYPKDRYLPRIENGRYVFQFRIFKGDVGSVCSQAELFNQKPYAVNVFPTGGTGEKVAGGLMKIIGDVQLTALKCREDGKIVLRIYNPLNKAVDFQLLISNDEISYTAGAYEVITLLYDKENGSWTVSPDQILL